MMFSSTQTYWKIELTSGKIITEGQLSFDFQRGTRRVDWALDIVSSGDIKHIRALTLCTPQGDVSLPILEPYTAFQLKRGTTSLLTGGKIVNAHIIGRVDDRESGACTAVIWDAIEQKLYLDHMTTVRAFTSWREGGADIGALALDVVGVRLT